MSEFKTASNFYSDVLNVRAQAPLVHNITNFVVMNWNANVLLASGASPVMAHAPEEIDEMVDLAHALVLNIGTLSAEWNVSMEKALCRASRKKIPVVLDPVGAGATQFRTQTVLKLLSIASPTVIRGNASEIIALQNASISSGLRKLEDAPKGVESVHSSHAALNAAISLSSTFQCVVCVSGETDWIVGSGRKISISNGASIMTRVTGMGCAATALIAAYLAVQPDPILATLEAMTVMGVSGEIAAERSSGSGSFQPAFLDALFNLKETDLQNRMKVLEK